jgi:general secretion pathway protein L
LKLLWSNRLRVSPQVKILQQGRAIYVDLLRSMSSAAPRQRKLQIVRLSAMAAAAAAVILLLAELYWRQSAAHADLSHNIMTAKERAVAVRAKLSKLESAAGQAFALHLLRNETISVIAIWQELTKLIPDSAWLSDLTIEKNSLLLSGFAESSAELLAPLEASPLSDHAGFTSPIIMAPGESFERFSIRLVLSAVPSSEQPSR